MRLMQAFAFKGVNALVRERNSLGDSFEHVAVKYFDIGKPYCLKKSDEEEFQAIFEQKLKLDIVKLTNEMSPLSRPQENEKAGESARSDEWIEKANQALEDDEEGEEIEAQLEAIEPGEDLNAEKPTPEDQQKTV